MKRLIVKTVTVKEFVYPFGFLTNCHEYVPCKPQYKTESCMEAEET
jgi:hypothetical protein